MKHRFKKAFKFEGEDMKRHFYVTSLAMWAICAGLVIALCPSPVKADSSKSGDRITREVRHQLVTLPYYSVFDNLAFQVNGDTVTLLGQVTRPTLKSSAENVVKNIEGVEHVDNKIE